MADACKLTAAQVDRITRRLLTALVRGVGPHIRISRAEMAEDVRERVRLAVRYDRGAKVYHLVVTRRIGR